MNTYPTHWYKGKKLPTHNMARDALCGECDLFHDYVYGTRGYRWLCKKCWVAQSDARWADPKPDTVFHGPGPASRVRPGDVLISAAVLLLLLALVQLLYAAAL